jgi:streptogramin lyase
VARSFVRWLSQTARVHDPAQRGLCMTLVVSTLVTLLAVSSCGQTSNVAAGPKVVGQIDVNNPRDVASGFGSIWVSSGPGGTVTRIDPKTGAHVATILLGAAASVFAVSPDAIWVTSYQDVMVMKIDPSSNQVVGSVNPGGKGPLGIAYFDGYIWVANHDGVPRGSVVKIDPAKMKVVDLIYLGDESQAGPNWIAVGAGSLWVGVPNADAVFRIDPVSDAVMAKIPDSGVGGEIVADDHNVWVAGGDVPGVTHIDPATNIATQVENEVGSGGALTMGEGYVWFGTSITLDRIDPKSRRVVGTLEMPGPSFGSTVAFGYVWITVRDSYQLYKIKP